MLDDPYALNYCPGRTYEHQRTRGSDSDRAGQGSFEHRPHPILRDYIAGATLPGYAKNFRAMSMMRDALVHICVTSACVRVWMFACARMVLSTCMYDVLGIQGMPVCVPACDIYVNVHARACTFFNFKYRHSLIFAHISVFLLFCICRVAEIL